MSDESEKPLVSKKGIVVDLFLSLIFFFFMREVLVPHVPSQDPSAILIVSSMTSLCMTGVFGLLPICFVLLGWTTQEDKISLSKLLSLSL